MRGSATLQITMKRTILENFQGPARYRCDIFNLNIFLQKRKRIYMSVICIIVFRAIYTIDKPTKYAHITVDM
jgi:hypothetical protein